ncbi:uncharacterized protein LOC143538261 [Bidens hawaiensis]|uniref:uncharacterized protein LOC143538261 n=1 Tax=Bidens hawaiensis TaxID=980011 RepID=UPI004048F077
MPKHVDLTANVSSILTGILPPKLQDPRTPIIHIQLGDFKMTRALLDLGAGVSIFPGSLYDQYDFSPLRKANTTVVLADLTLKLPWGIITEVIVMTEDFYYPVDFLVLDYVTVDPKRHPNMIIVEINDRLNSHENEEDATEQCVICCRSAVEHSFQLKEEERAFEVYAAGIGKPPWSQQVEKLVDTIDSKLKPSLETPPVVELKELPKHLKYVFLRENETLPAIIGSNL